MSDPKKTAEITGKLQDISRSLTSRESTLSGLEREKNDKVRDYDQQIQRVHADAESTLSRLEREKSDKVRDFDQRIKNVQAEIAQLNKQIADLRKQL